VIVLENQEYEAIIGSPEAPFMNEMARRYGFATQFYGTTHPSVPNYLAMIGGATFGITTNCYTCHVDEENLVDQLETANISWRAYMESVPSRCYKGPETYEYSKGHNPFAYFDSIMNDPARCAKIQPLGALKHRIRTGHKLPRFVWISPNRYHNMHNYGVRSGDRWLAHIVPKLLEALGRNSVIFITFDEGTTNDGCCAYAAGGHSVLITVGPSAARGAFDPAIDHYSLLRLIEDAWGLPRLNLAADPQTPSMDGMLR